MSHKSPGVQAKVKELHHLTMYSLSSNHVSNLVISSASELRVIINALSAIGEVRTFLSRFAHQVQVLQGNITKKFQMQATND